MNYEYGCESWVQNLVLGGPDDGYRSTALWGRLARILSLELSRPRCMAQKSCEDGERTDY